MELEMNYDLGERYDVLDSKIGVVSDLENSEDSICKYDISKPIRNVIRGREYSGKKEI
ncbi:MAG: hypothetical protein K0R72_944 [Clostridia bacterium]|jgi:hypothetical protein|nr:hypothetical protein [Clostridia bacterium]